jgi:hypothetical protein
MSPEAAHRSIRHGAPPRQTGPVTEVKPPRRRVIGTAHFDPKRSSRAERRYSRTIEMPVLLKAAAVAGYVERPKSEATLAGRRVRWLGSIGRRHRPPETALL